MRSIPAHCRPTSVAKWSKMPRSVYRNRLVQDVAEKALIELRDGQITARSRSVLPDGIRSALRNQ